jgi:large subunit ribosomal protein L29
MKSSELKDYSVDQLKIKISEEKQTLTKLRFAHAVSSVENPMRIHNTRKDIARLNTELQSRILKEKAINASSNEK